MMPSARQQDVTACALVAGLFDSGMYSLEELRDALAPAYRVDTELRQEGIGQRLLARDVDEGPVMITALNHSLAQQVSARVKLALMAETERVPRFMRGDIGNHPRQVSVDHDRVWKHIGDIGVGIGKGAR